MQQSGHDFTQGLTLWVVLYERYVHEIQLIITFGLILATKRRIYNNASVSESIVG